MPNAAELRELDDDELENRLAEFRRELLNLRFQLATGQLDNVARLGQVRKDVARVLTLMRDREIALAEGRDAGPVMRPVRPDRPPRRRPVEEDEVEVADEAEVADEVEVADEAEVAEAPRPARRRSRAKVAAAGEDEVEADGGDAAGDADEEEA